ncbi:MAG: hypothetical protein Q7R35_04635 [Elusimicrobiota bacterium]|nr:hypothetical protein [Elusimicrobiota bacterium]
MKIWKNESLISLFPLLENFLEKFPFLCFINNTKNRRISLNLKKSLLRPVVAGRVGEGRSGWLNRRPVRVQGYASAITGAMLIKRPMAS